MSTKLKCPKKGNITKTESSFCTETSPKQKCPKILNVTKTEMLPKLKGVQNKDFIKTEISPTLYCHTKNESITKTEMSSK